MEITVKDMSFRAKLGKNIIKQVNREFNNDKTKLDKYTHLFEDAFASNIDKETVVDINKNRNFVFSNNNFPDVKYQHSIKMKKTDSMAKALINECFKLFGEGEYGLFKVIICKYANKNTDFHKLEQYAESIINSKSRESFLEKIKVAERFKKEYPDSKISREGFDYMQNIIMQEEAETPGTKLYNLIHNFGKSELSFI